MRTFVSSGLAAVLLLTGATLCPGQQSPPKEIVERKSGDKVKGKTLYQWTDDLKSKDPSVREQAIAVLKAYGKYAQDKASVVIQALRDPDASVRVNAAITLGFIGMEEKDREAGISALARMLRDSQGIVKYQAARALARFGSDANPALEALIVATRDNTTWEIRQAAVAALSVAAWVQTSSGEYGFDARAFRPLLERLNDYSAEVRLEGLYGLLRMGKPMRPLDVQTELQFLHPLWYNTKQPEKVQIWARVTLMRIGQVSEHDLGPILKFLKTSPNPEARIHAARAMAFIGYAANTHVPDLLSALDDKEPEVLAWCCIALGEMREAGRQAIPTLRKLTQHPDQAVKDAANQAISSLENVAENPITDKPKRNSK